MKKNAILTVLCLTMTFGVVACLNAADYSVQTITLPGASDRGISMDYIAFDPVHKTVWAPAGNTGAVDVIDAKTLKIRQVTGFVTAEMGSGDRKRVVGPSSVSIGGTTAYVGNRGDFSICAFDTKSLMKGACHRLDSMPDGVAWVGSTNEVWVTTPRDKSIRVLDAKTLEEKAKLTFDGNPEGFAVDGIRHRFYTNLEDKDRTLAIDLTTRKTVATWNPACGEDGPHGLRVDEKSGHLFVGCSAKAEILDAAHDGAVLSSIDTGDGVDDIDYSPASHHLYVGAARSGQLTVARDVDGRFETVARVAVPNGARNPAVTDDGKVFLAHSGKLNDVFVATPRKK